MSPDSPLSDICRLFEKTFGCPPLASEEISACGSYRCYFRLRGRFSVENSHKALPSEPPVTLLSGDSQTGAPFSAASRTGGAAEASGEVLAGASVSGKTTACGLDSGEILNDAPYPAASRTGGTVEASGEVLAGASVSGKTTACGLDSREILTDAPLPAASRNGGAAGALRVDASGAFSVMACWNADVKENTAFVSFARRFRQAGLPVPAIYAVDEPSCIYLQEDLGDETLYDRVKKMWLEPLAADASYPFPEELMDLYRQSLSQLVRLQVAGRDVIDYAFCTPCPAFHRDAIHWDLNYFKYFFLKLMRVPFDEQALEDDFRAFSAYLLQADCSFFLFRDFQSANIMLRGDSVCFIDFQGGRKGALQYDPASLLYDAKTLLPSSVRSQLIAHYYSELTRFITISSADFYSYYQGYTLCRLLQALAAFGLRGVVEHKPGFRESIPPALSMLSELLSDWRLPIELPELKNCLRRCQSVEVEKC